MKGLCETPHQIMVLQGGPKGNGPGGGVWGQRRPRSRTRRRSGQTRSTLRAVAPFDQRQAQLLVLFRRQVGNRAGYVALDVVAGERDLETGDRQAGRERSGKRSGDLTVGGPCGPIEIVVILVSPCGYGVGELVAMGMRDLGNQAVGTLEAELSAGFGRTAAVVVGTGRGRVVQQRPQVTIAEALQGEFGTADGLQEPNVLGGPRLQGPHPSAVPGRGPAERFGQGAQRLPNPAASICRASPSRPLRQTWIEKGNHVCKRRCMKPNCGCWK